MKLKLGLFSNKHSANDRDNVTENATVMGNIYSFYTDNNWFLLVSNVMLKGAKPTIAESILFEKNTSANNTQYDCLIILYLTIKIRYVQLHDFLVVFVGIVLVINHR